jgi:hypothetical protein
MTEAEKTQLEAVVIKPNAEAQLNCMISSRHLSPRLKPPVGNTGMTSTSPSKWRTTAS